MLLRNKNDGNVYRIERKKDGFYEIEIHGEITKWYPDDFEPEPDASKVERVINKYE